MALSSDACYLYVTDFHKNRVNVLDASSGARRYSFAVGDDAHSLGGICATWGKYVYRTYVCDPYHDVVFINDAITGSLVHRLLNPRIRSPLCVVVSRHRIYVACSNCIVVFRESDGSFLFWFGRSFFNYTAIAASVVTGHVYVVDHFLVDVFSEDGEFLRELSIPESTGIKFNPRHICVSVKDEVYVSDCAGCVRVFDSSGAYDRTIDLKFGSNNIRGLALSRDGRLFVADSGATCVHVLE